jgi:hypothetical protein
VGTNLRMLAVVATASLVGLVLVAAASASGETKSNAAVTISASIMGSGPNPDVATVGDRINVSMGIKSNIRGSQWVHIYLTADMPFGLLPTLDVLKKMQPGDNWQTQFQFRVFRFMPLGHYGVTLITDSPDIIDSLAVSAGITVR